MFTVIYRWRILQGREGDFERAWRSRTDKIAAVRGSFGSRLHREEDGTYCAIALWPDRDAWEAIAPLPDDEHDTLLFAESIERAFPPRTMNVVDDRWTPRSLPVGYSDLPPGTMANVVTCLEMRAPADLGAVHSDIDSEQAAPLQPARYRALYRAVGAPYLWFSRLQLSDADLNSIINDRDVEVHVAREGNEDIGLLELDFRVAGECEVVFFGLVPAAVGRGWGRLLMRRAIERAWRRPIERLWVHTCTLDHPSAVGFYIKCGFTPYKRQIEIHEDPRLNGTLPPDAAPGVPVI